MSRLALGVAVQDTSVSLLALPCSAWHPSCC